VKLLLVVLAMMFAVPAVHAADNVMDGNRLLEQCTEVESHPSSFYSGMCIGFVSGTQSGYLVAHAWSDGKTSICMPKEVTNGQSVKIVVKYLKDHPEELHLAAESLVLRAFNGAFPCGDNTDLPKR
jgi:Rap1a immunity proteins